MTTIKEMSLIYRPKNYRNISELKSVDVTADIKLFVDKDESGEEYSYNYIEINGEKYRIPDSVLRDLKNVLEKKPNLRSFAVSKSGEGKQTRYTVIPLE